MIKGKRRWLGVRVWVAAADGKRHHGTLWWIDDDSAMIREDGRTGLVAFPKAAEGARWGVVEGDGETAGANGGSAP